MKPNEAQEAKAAKDADSRDNSDSISPFTGGGKTAAVLKSFIATCHQAKLDPWSYLVDVLKRIGDHPMNALDELLPNNWKLAEASNRSMCEAHPEGLRPGFTGRLPNHGGF
ncbi:MAG: transposase domain-containing protein [Bryobacterales bacterium]|nr:transposase domain-containing protein [Bryobacterales bacterium]